MFNQRLMRQMQGKLEKVNQELAELRIEATVGGGVVKAVANGQQAILSIEIDPSVVDPDDVEMLQDLVVAAMNEALNQSREAAAKKLSSVTGGARDSGAVDDWEYAENGTDGTDSMAILPLRRSAMGRSSLTAILSRLRGSWMPLLGYRGLARRPPSGSRSISCVSQLNTRVSFPSRSLACAKPSCSAPRAFISQRRIPVRSARTRGAIALCSA